MGSWWKQVIAFRSSQTSKPLAAPSSSGYWANTRRHGCLTKIGRWWWSCDLRGHGCIPAVSTRPAGLFKDGARSGQNVRSRRQAVCGLIGADHPVSVCSCSAARKFYLAHSGRRMDIPDWVPDAAGFFVSFGLGHVLAPVTFTLPHPCVSSPLNEIQSGHAQLSRLATHFFPPSPLSSQP